MSANRRRKAASRQGARATPVATAGPLENRIKEEVTAGMKQRLGLAESEKVPAPIQDLVDSAARDAAESAVEIAVIREVEEVTTRLARVSHWRDGSKSTTASSDVSLLREAEQLAAKKKALEAAGFSSDEAMRILIAGVVGGHSQTHD
jgi:hypothetical protein